MKNLKKDNKGFSLVELLVVIAIMVVLVGVVAPTLLGNIEKSRVSSDIQALDNVAAAIQVAIGDEKAYTEMMADPGKALKVSDYIGGSGTAFKDVVTENLSAVPAMKGTEASKAGNTNIMYFSISSSGKVTVWLSTDSGATVTVPTTVPANKTDADSAKVRFDKNTAYCVIR